jgi:hypothetical protein
MDDTERPIPDAAHSSLPEGDAASGRRHDRVPAKIPEAIR